MDVFFDYVFNFHIKIIRCSLSMIFISIIESCFGRNQNKHTEGNTVGSFPECGNSAFVEQMLFAHTDKEYDKTCKCLNDPPCPLKDNVRQILIIQCVTS